MTKSNELPIHLRSENGVNYGPLTLCGVRALVNWTDDVQAVTCPKCQDKMDLQPA